MAVNSVDGVRRIHRYGRPALTSAGTATATGLVGAVEL
ncbi:MAG: hypothetical protein ACJA07_002058 [Rhodococcus sp. (in: high G+C Gram-positive bacteria)]|jgi:hypothetical protein